MFSSLRQNKMYKKEQNLKNKLLDCYNIYSLRLHLFSGLFFANKLPRMLNYNLKALLLRQNTLVHNRQNNIYEWG